MEQPLARDSYASSPAAEVFYAKTKLTREAPTASLSLKGGVFQQVEGVALVKGGKQAEAAGQFIEFCAAPRCSRRANHDVDATRHPRRACRRGDAPRPHAARV